VFDLLQDQVGKVPLYWGITADGYVAFADDVDLLKGACGKSLASFPQGSFFSFVCSLLNSRFLGHHPLNGFVCVFCRLLLLDGIRWA